MLHPRSWVDDKSVAECCRCATPFTFLRRRHHCRHCGGVFCGPCTQQQLWLRPWPAQSLQERLPSQAQSLADNNSNNDDDDDGHRINRVVSRTADVVREHASGSPSHNRNASSLSTNSDRNVANAEAEPPLFECVPRATAAPATATAAVGAGSCAGVPDTGAADHRTRSAGAAGAPHFRTISSSSRGGGAMSRQVSDAFFSSSVYTISPMTVGGDGSQQTWATPTPLPGLERTTSQQQEQQQHAPSASISSAETLNESRPPRVPATSALEERSVAPRPHHHSSSGDHAGYLRASYQVEVDARKTLWLLCRVCQACYDSLLDTILDAHERSSPLAPPTHPPTESPATSRSQLGPCPLWQYVRLSRSSTHSSSHTGVQPSSPDAPPSLTLTNSGSTTAGAAATPPRPGGTWARLRNSLSFPSSPLSSFVSTASVALQSEGSDPSAMPPPALRPHDLRRTREAAASPTAAPSPSRTQQSTKGPARGTLAATAGVPGLPARLYEPAVAAAGSRGGPVPSEGSRHSSPASLGHVTDASMLSVSSVSLQPGSRQTTDVVSPKLKYAQQQQSQQRSVRFLVTPPRRRLISIGSTTGHIRQACAIARRRRRVAVILIDEREPAELDESTVRVRLTEARGDWAQLATAAFLSRQQQQQQLPLQQSQLTSRAAQPAKAASTVLSLSPCASPTSPNACSARYDGVAAEGRRDGATSVGPPIATPVPAPLAAEESTSTEEATTTPATATAATPTTFENASLAQDPQLSSLSLESPTVRVHGAVAQPSGSRPALSIVVDVENEDGSSEAGGQSRDHAALCGLSPHDWLQPTLPAEAIALPASGTNSNTNINNSANFPLTSIGSSSSSNNTHHSKKHTIACDSDSLATHALEYRSETPSPHWMGRDGHARTAGATPPDAALATTSRPISCAGVQGPSPSTPRHTAAAALAPAHQQQQQQQHRLPALALAADCGSCVLSALFHDLGATRATAFATPLLAALTPTAAAAGGARLLRGGGAAGVTSAAAAAAAYMDPVVMAGGLPPTDWGTGPESYAAQRQALVRELVLRQHRNAVGAAGGGDGSVSPVTPPAGSGGSGNTQRSPPTLEAAFGSGAGVFSATAATPRSTALSPLSLHERVTAPVSVFFQLRAQSDEPAAPSPSHSAGAGANAALPLSPLSILPVVAQVEMVGIPIDVSASPAQALPKPTQTPTRAFTVSPRTLAISGSSTHAASAAAAAGTQRPFTLAEFLPQLSRLSTNLDGYLVVVLRCGSRHRHHPCESASPNLRPTDCSPAAAPPGHGVRSRSGSEYVNAPAAAGSKARQHTVSTPAATAYRISRVTEPFGGPQLRLLHQQLQSCGVAQPALSIVEVCEDSPSSLASSPSGWRTGGHGCSEAEASPASVASASSPFSDRGGRSSVFTAAASTAAVASPMCTRQSTSANTTINIATATAVATTAAQMWSHSPSSPNNLAVSPVMAAAASPLMPASSSTRLLVPAAEPPEDAYGRMSNEHQQQVRRSLDRPEVLDKLTLPSSLQSTREPLSMPEASAAQQLPAGAEMRRHEQMRLAAQERAMATLRATSKQLGLPIATVAYPSAAGGALESGAMINGAEPSAESPLRSGGAAVGGDAGRTPKGRNGGSGVTASNALLARGLESLMATMVYRDLTAQQ